jgi:hypothetical protein
MQVAISIVSRQVPRHGNERSGNPESDYETSRATGPLEPTPETSTSRGGKLCIQLSWFRSSSPRLAGGGSQCRENLARASE